MSFSETLDGNRSGVGRKSEAVAPDHVEAQLQTKADDTGLLYDVHGMLLIPQPTDRSDDPLVPKPKLVTPCANDRHGANTINFRSF